MSNQAFLFPENVTPKNLDPRSKTQSEEVTLFDLGWRSVTAVKGIAVVMALFGC